MRTLVVLMLLTSSASAAELADVVRAQVDASLPAGLGVVTIALPAAASTAPLHAGDVAIRWVVPPRAGIVPLYVSWRHGRGMAQATLAPLRRVMIVSRALTAGARIDEGDLIASERAVVDAHTAFPSDANGKTVARDLTAGDVLRASDLMPPSKVARGSHVHVIVKRGGVTIEADGVLERVSAIGDRNAARVPGVPTLINGRLRDESTLVDEGDSP